MARADGSPQRFYSLSAQIQRERKAYYDILERTQKQSLDVTEWLAWFLATLHRAVDQAQRTLDAVLVETRFWQRWAAPTSARLNERQVKLVNRLLDGFEDKLTSSKWAAIAKCSPDTTIELSSVATTLANPKRADQFERNANGRPLRASFRFNQVNNWVRPKKMNVTGVSTKSYLTMSLPLMPRARW